MSSVRETITMYGAEQQSDEFLLNALGINAQSIEHALRYPSGTPLTMAKMAALAEIVRRSTRTVELQRVNSPRGAGEYLLPSYGHLTEECFGLLALDAKGNIRGERIVSRGTCTATLISPREVFRTALQLGASTVLVFHNHPSGDPTPSREDTILTRRLRECGDSLGVPLADHIVLGMGRYHSFRAAEGWDK